MTRGTPILEIEKVAVDFRDEGLPWFSRLSERVRAVDGVSLVLHDGETLGIVGESGSGKTTLARTLLRLIRPSEGVIRYKGRNVSMLRGRDLRWFRREVQIVFQDPYESLNPAFTISRSFEEPLRIPGGHQRRRREEIVRELLGRVGLTPPSAYLSRYPHELSGGQLQRVAIARALIVEPSLLIADEPVSMLDVSIRAGIMALLEDLVRERNLTCIYISHDLGLVRYLCSRTIVMYRGLIVEEGPTEEVICRPRHPYTAALIRAAPTVEHGIREPLSVLPQERVDVTHPACRFYPRCPMAFDPCKTVEPALEPVGGNGQTARCHLFGPLDEGRWRTFQKELTCHESRAGTD
jgi:oligopeptide/dipeptide ABC transporter ATP-binding protein